MPASQPFQIGGGEKSRAKNETVFGICREPERSMSEKWDPMRGKEGMWRWHLSLLVCRWFGPALCLRKSCLPSRCRNARHWGPNPIQLSSSDTGMPKEHAPHPKLGRLLWRTPPPQSMGTFIPYLGLVFCLHLSWNIGKDWALRSFV